ncbi:MAG: tRNA-guanine transglycosylase [Candidatus Paceibacterota bacterium]
MKVLKKLISSNLQKYIRDFSPLDEGCDCQVCQQYSKAYVAHLFRAKEMLGPHLASLRNLYTIVNFTKCLREEMPMHNVGNMSNIAFIDGQNLHLGTYGIDGYGWKVDLNKFRGFI